MNNNDTLKVEVISPVQVLFKGASHAVSSMNNKGPFDILPGHAQFISLIKGKVVVLTEEGKKNSFELSRGVIDCKDNAVKIYVGI
jgi:F0F1-type ATP synthase epsilon subunit